jgi:thiosulfate reductase cytochrome b subunit
MKAQLISRIAASRQSRWHKFWWIVPVTIVVVAIVVVAARGVRGLPATQSFLRDFPGASPLPASAPVGFPAWLAWQHGLNVFFILFIIRSGWLVRITARPKAYWTRDNKALLKTQGQPVKISMDLWLHLSLDALWVLNGLLFYVLLFATGQWRRLVPTRWDIFPNALSAAIQYASLNWPVDNGWANYNALQVLSYFLIVFVAAPLALITGIRMSPGLAPRLAPLEKLFPTSVARKVHFPVMVFFVGFVIVHVTLVFATGALTNLNRMYAARDDNSWAGFVIFAASVLVMVAVWFAAKPVVLRSIAGFTGRVGR